MPSVSVSDYPVPLFDDSRTNNTDTIFIEPPIEPQRVDGYVWRSRGMKYEWGDGGWKELPPDKELVTRRDLEKRLADVRKVKLEVEEEKYLRGRKIRFLTKRLNTVNEVLYKHGDVHKALYKSEKQLNRARLRMMELKGRVAEVENDYDRIFGEVEKYRKEFRCKTCLQVKKVECFGKDVDQPTGYDSRCRLCLREKTKQWRAAKRVVEQ